MAQQVDPADTESGNVDFGEPFNTLLIMAQSGQDLQFVHSQKFNLFKKWFGDQLSLSLTRFLLNATDRPGLSLPHLQLPPWRLFHAGTPP
jgi:hypothetical protein